MTYPFRADQAQRATWPAGCVHLENGFIVGAAAHYEAQHSATDEESTAEDIAVENMDQFSDWLAGHCYQRYSVAAPVIRGGVGQMEMIIERSTVPELATLMLHARADVRAQACSEMQQRYLAECVS